MGAGTVVMIVVGAIVIVLIIDYAARTVKAIFATSCGLITAVFLPDICAGPCLPGTGPCAATARGPYPAWLGRFAPSTQPIACGCAIPAAPGSAPATGIGGVGAGSGSGDDGPK